MEAILAALSELGAPLPPGPLPELDRKVNFTPYVEVPSDLSSRVLELLTERHRPRPGGPTFGFNYKDDDTAWARAEDGIDLQGIVDEALVEDVEL